MKTSRLSGLALLALGVLFVLLTALLNRTVRGARVDLTENRLYTLTAGTQNIVRGLKEPVNLYFYYSAEAAEDIPIIKNYAVRVQEFLQELTARSAGQLRLKIINPEPSSEEEDRAAEAGLRALPIGPTGETLYFGLTGSNSTDGRAVIEFFDNAKEQFLEYDIAKLIYQLGNPKRPVVGWLTGLPMGGSFNPNTGQPTEPWIILAQTEQLFNVKQLQPTLTEIETDIDVLVIVHPKDLPPAAQVAIDKYALRGGRLLVFVDPSAEGDNSGADPSNPMSQLGVDRKSSFAALLTAWGIDFDNTQVLGDAERGLVVTVRQGDPPTRHIGILGLDAANMATKDVITGSLSSINVYTGGILSARAGAKTRFEPLLRSSTAAAPIAGERFQMLMDPETLFEGFKPTGQAYVLAARVTGDIASAFPEGTPGAQAGALKKSSKPLNAIVVADTDMLQDFLWVRSQNMFGQRVITPEANNGDFVWNAIENLAGSNDLISVRGRASFNRPFARVETLRREAEQRFRTQEQRLDAELSATEQKLAELQNRRGDATGTLLSAEQKAELDRFAAERSRIRRELRAVKLDLNRGIESLGSRLKLLNIVVWPLLLAAVALIYPWWRRRRHAAIVMLEAERKRAGTPNGDAA